MERDDSAQATVFIEDGCFMDTVFAEGLDDFHDIHGFGNINGTAQAVF